MPRVPSPIDLPAGFRYVADAVTVEEEQALLAGIATLTLDPVRIHGYEGKRRTAHYGVVYGYDSRRVTPGPDMPPFLVPLRDRAAGLAGEPADRFTEALITEYPAGAVIGWHRDAPMFGPTVLGISLAGACRMRFRRPAPDRGGAFERADILLAPRSLYVIGGAARSAWQHSIPAVDAVRYSVTFRSVRTRTRR
jgi:alkylated DNA repair protein (DNA oxidative demethylase)